MDRCTAFLNIPPRFVTISKCGTIPNPPLPYQTWIPGCGSMDMTSPPGCLVMSDGHGVISTGTVDDTQICQFRHCQIAATQAVNDDFAIVVNRPNRRDSTPDQSGVILTGHAIFTRIGRLINQIKTKKFTRYRFVSTGKRLPQRDECVLRDVILPEIASFQVVAIGAVAWGAMQIQRHVNAARLAGLQISINVLEHGFVRIAVIKVPRQKTII